MRTARRRLRKIATVSLVVVGAVIAILLTVRSNSSRPAASDAGKDSLHADYEMFVEFMHSDNNRQKMHLMCALKQMIAGKPVDPPVVGKTEEVRQLFEKGGALYQWREKFLVLMEKVAVDGRPEEDSFKNVPFK